jgi:hypothetical protein
VPIRLTLYEPDIPQNAGTIVRMAACLGVAVDFVEPAGFLLGDGNSAAPASTTSSAPRSAASRRGGPGSRHAMAPDSWC